VIWTTRCSLNQCLTLSIHWIYETKIRASLLRKTGNREHLLNQHGGYQKTSRRTNQWVVWYKAMKITIDSGKKPNKKSPVLFHQRDRTILFRKKPRFSQIQIVEFFNIKCLDMVLSQLLEVQVSTTKKGFHKTYKKESIQGKFTLM
jgi:hypothetical protein